MTTSELGGVDDDIYDIIVQTEELSFILSLTGDSRQKSKN